MAYMVSMSVRSIGVVSMPAKQAARLVENGCAHVDARRNPMYVLNEDLDDVILAVPGAYVERRIRTREE